MWVNDLSVEIKLRLDNEGEENSACDSVIILREGFIVIERKIR